MTPRNDFQAGVTRRSEPGVLLVMNEVAAISAGTAGESTVEYLVSGSFDDVLVDLYRTHAKPLVEMLWVFVGDRGEAEDLCQEAFMRLLRSWRRIDPSRNAGAYLRATAFNLARSGFRRRLVAQRLRPAPEPEGAAAADEGVELRADQRQLLDALRRLPARQREYVVLRYWQDQSDAEIAATLGISANSVKTHLRRAMERLEHDLEIH
jgi:RNA polymerase sigma-70 factor (sigma-E family)